MRKKGIAFNAEDLVRSVEEVRDRIVEQAVRGGALRLLQIARQHPEILAAS